MPTKFADINKGPKDLLSDDYTTKFSIKAKKAAGPVTFTFETEQSPTTTTKGSFGGPISSKIGTKFSYGKFNLDKGQLKADGNPVFESSIKLSPELKCSFKANKGSDLGFDYVKGDLYVTTVVDVASFNKVNTSASITLPTSGIVLGGDVSYGGLSNGSGGPTLTGYNIGASYTSGPLFTSLTATSKLSQYNLSMSYKVDDKLTLASITQHSQSKMCTVSACGGSYKVPKESMLGGGTIKSKMDSDGILHACYIRDVVPKVTLTVSGCGKPSDTSTFKTGIALNM